MKIDKREVQVVMGLLERRLKGSGVSVEEVQSGKRLPSLVYIRCQVHKVAKGLGFHHLVIGEVLRRDYSSLYHYDKLHEEMLNCPNVREYREGYAKYIKYLL